MFLLLKVAINCSLEYRLTQNGTKKGFYGCFLERNDVIKIIPKSTFQNGVVAVLMIWPANLNRYTYKFANVKKKQF